MPARHWHLVGYDVRDPKRLRKAAKTLEGYGERVQLSLFRCRLDNRTVEKLRLELALILEPEDDLLIVPICEACAAKVAVRSETKGDDWADPPPTFEIL